MTRVSDLDFTVSTKCNSCGHASTGIPLKWWHDNAAQTDNFYQLRRVHEPSYRTRAPVTSGKQIDAPSGWPRRRGVPPHGGGQPTRLYSDEVRRQGSSGEWCTGGRRSAARVQVKSVHALLDPKGRTRIRVEYASATAQQIDAEATKRILCSRLMEFYAVSLSDARPEHGGGALSWNLGDLMIRPGEVI
jgi:hypothetical protein